MKIAILDTVPEEFWHHDNGVTDGEKFVYMLSPWLPDVDLAVYYVAESQFPPQEEKFDGYLITGSPISVNDDFGWISQLEDLVRQLSARQKKIAGFCFGHQLIASALGGEVADNENGWHIGLFDVHIEKLQSWMHPAQLSTSLYHFNKERVVILPADAEPYARSDQYPNLGFTAGNHIMAIQGHPEQSLRAMHNFLKATEGMVPENVAQQAMASMESAHPDAALWGRWIAGFYQGQNIG